MSVAKESSHPADKKLAKVGHIAASGDCLGFLKLAQALGIMEGISPDDKTQGFKGVFQLGASIAIQQPCKSCNLAIELALARMLDGWLLKQYSSHSVAWHGPLELRAMNRAPKPFISKPRNLIPGKRQSSAQRLEHVVLGVLGFFCCSLNCSALGRDAARLMVSSP